MLLKDCFDFEKHAVISIIGSGGKTTLMQYIAQSYRHQRVLMSTTTKIFVPTTGQYDVALHLNQDFKHLQPGIYLMGQPITTKMGPKLAAIDLDQLTMRLPYFDKVILEADGAHQRLLKAWRVGEPVLLPQTTVTLAILPMNSLDQPLTADVVHRLPQFLEFGTFQVGQKITPQVLATVIEHDQGLVKQALEPVVLVLTHVTDEQKLKAVQQIVARLQPKTLQNITKIIASDTTKGWGDVIWNHKK